MNGNWYPWGDVNGNTPKDYKAMWIHVHNIFTQAGASNTIWVWSPNNSDAYGKSDSVLSYYPGDSYVDWVAYSGFNWGTSDSTKWTSFEDLSQDIYSILSQTNKPIMVAETSSVTKGGDKNVWFEQMIASLPTMPNIKAVIFYNDVDKQSDFRLTSGMDTSLIVTNNLIQNSYVLKKPSFVVYTTKVSYLNYLLSMLR